MIDDVTVDASGSLHVTDFVTTRARFGWAIGNFMPYATLGLAFGRADEAVSANTTVVELDPNSTPPNQVVGTFFFPNGQSKNGAYLYGFAGGLGLDFALTQKYSCAENTNISSGSGFGRSI